MDTQARVRIAEKAMGQVKAKVRWVSIEPMLENIQMDFGLFDWVVLGGASKSNQTPEWRPPWNWICRITAEAIKNGCRVYHKDNLYPRECLRDYPGVVATKPILPPGFRTPLAPEGLPIR